MSGARRAFRPWAAKAPNNTARAPLTPARKSQIRIPHHRQHGGRFANTDGMNSEWVTADDGVRLGFERLGPSGPERRPVLLVHGFGSSRVQNWKSTGWFAALTGAGYPLLAMDCRGHGLSDKPHDEQFYGHERMAKDVALVMDAAGIGQCDLVGYSMGGFIGIRLAAAAPGRLARLCLGGVGEHYLTGAKISSEGPRN